LGAFDPKGAVIVAVEPEGPAALAGLAEGDAILLVDGVLPQDLMDFQDRSSSGRVVLTVRRDEKTFETYYHRDEEESLGLEFSDTLFNRVKTCRNKCVFCFMDQMPKKMRASLYYRDDDYRLSNLHGNFITLTNLSESEWERIRQQRVSPLYISVHATEETLREELLGSTRQAKMDLMGCLRQLIEWGIELHTQVLLMPGLNDGEHLDRTLNDLGTLLPHVQTISIVPVGLTRYRAHLPHLQPVTPVMIPPLMKQVERYQERFLEQVGDRVVFLADEMYLIAGLPMPPHSYYGEYPQLENGIGMVRHFLLDFPRRRRYLKAPWGGPTRWLMITGEYGGQIFPPLLDEIRQRLPEVDIRLAVVPNRFFGPLVKCSGLLSGRDMLTTLEERRDFLSQPGTHVMIAGNALKDAAVIGLSQRGMLLDDISLQSLADRFQVPFVNAGSSCTDWLQTMRDGQGLERFDPSTGLPEEVVVIQYPEHAAPV